MSQQKFTLTPFWIALLIVGLLPLGILLYFAYTGFGGIFLLLTPIPYIILLCWYYLGYMLLKKNGWKFPGISLSIASLVGIFPIFYGSVSYPKGEGQFILTIGMVIMISILIAMRKIPTPKSKT